MQTQNGPHAVQGGEGRENSGERSGQHPSTDWRTWLDLPERGWLTDGGVETLDWVVSA